jgi:hypothetical protein
MKSFLQPLLLLSVPMALAACALHAQEAAPPDKPLLWKVEGNSLEKASYLFGTIHLTTPRIEKLHPAAEKAFDTSDTVATEMSMDPEAMLASTMLMMRKDGSTLSGAIGDELAGKLDATLKGINPALDAAIMEPMKTWAVAAAVTLLPYQLEGRKALDQLIWQRAKDADKQAIGLETMKEQVAAFEVLNEAEQVVFLKSTLENFAKNDRLLREMIADYEKGDAEAINQAFIKSIRDLGENDRERAVGEKLLKSIMIGRDRTMAETIDAMLRKDSSKSYFIAVGAGHLIGENGIRAHLEKKGWKINRIEG